MRKPCRPILYFLLSIFYFLVSIPAYSDQVILTEIEMMLDRGYDYLDIYASGQAKGKGLLLEDELRIDFPGVKVSSDLKIVTRQSKRIARVSARQVRPDLARVVVKLKKPVDYDIVNVFGRGKTVVELADRSDQSEKAMTAWETKRLKEQRVAIKPVKYAPAAAGRDRSLAGRTIVLDPGHGGRDPGAIAVNGLPEKQLTLAVARKAAAMLKAAGATVYLTRDGDQTTGLRDVVAFANRIKADIFISIHYNFADQGSIRGSETYYARPASRRLALLLHQSLQNEVGQKDRGLRRANYYVVKHTNMPAVLLEPLYLSNAAEAKLAAAPEFQARLAAAMVKGVKAYVRSRSD